MNVFFIVCLIALAALTVLCLIRAIAGPRLADRIMAVNMIGTMTIAMILILSALLDEPALVDAAVIYAVISFVSVIVLAKIYIGVYREKKASWEQRRKEDRP